MSQPPDDDTSKPQSRPSLIPSDVWESYQEEVSGPELIRSGIHTNPMVPAVAPDEPDPVTAEFLIGPTQTTTVDPAQAQEALSGVALFAGLAPSSLLTLAQTARQAQLTVGQFLFVQGEQADSFYVVVEGALDAFRKREEIEQPLRRIGAGEWIGLFGLFSGRVRAASVVAATEVTVLEFPCAAIDDLLDVDAELHHRVVNFFRDRLVEAFIADSPVFTEVEPNARAGVSKRFVERLFAPQETVVAPGEVSNQLLLVMHGKLRVEQRSRTGASETPPPTALNPGDFLAVTGANHGVPCQVRVLAETQTSVALLGIRELAELSRDYPGLRQLTTRLSGSARELERYVFCGQGGSREV